MSWDTESLRLAYDQVIAHTDAEIRRVQIVSIVTCMLGLSVVFLLPHMLSSDALYARAPGTVVSLASIVGGFRTYTLQKNRALLDFMRDHVELQTNEAAKFLKELIS